MSEPKVVDLTVDMVTDIVVKLLAEQWGATEEDVLAELSEAGREMPIDSVLIVEILARVEAMCGVRIAADADAARSMQSVRSFAETVVAAARANGGKTNGYDTEHGQHPSGD